MDDNTLNSGVCIQILSRPDAGGHFMINVNQEITRVPSGHLCLPFPDDLSALIEMYGEVGGNILYELREVTGIATISLSRYQMRVGIGSLFRWSTIEPTVLEALKKILNAPSAKTTREV